MAIDTYGLSSEQYEEFFEDNVEFAAKLYVKACGILNSAGAVVDFKTALDVYQETVYQTNDDCRRYQKANNPDALKKTDDIYSLGPTREELMEEIQAVNAKVEALTDYLSELVKVTTKGLTDLVD